ncbi:unnamed protein product [Periconia digitata]|uniref:Maltose/galactoside acetyltransferase domain-containing protein n=1 Tax=Periconia digitata TaxID=1303443 RepID=A0A9W4UAD0_9PLEO|nr:unnamed protein product [Periconia digitata]
MERNYQSSTYTNSKNMSEIERARSKEHVPWCEEYEMMISGMMYRSWLSAELAAGRSRSERICNEYNDLLQSNNPKSGDSGNLSKKRSELLMSLLGVKAESATIERPFSVLYGCNTDIGNNLFANVGLSIDDSAFVTIGNDVLIGPEVCFITTNHPTEVSERVGGGMYALPIEVGDACWIGARATILPGAVIGKGCTIGAGAVVAGTIPEYSVAVGVPAKVTRKVIRADSNEDPEISK